jgi:hypothetical protein
MEARNLAPLPADIDYTVAAALLISGLTAWQALMDHAHLGGRFPMTTYEANAEEMTLQDCLAERAPRQDSTTPISNTIATGSQKTTCGKTTVV